MTFVTITSKGQMTLPKEIRDELKLKAGDKLLIEKQGDGYVLRPRRSALELFTKFRRPDRKPVTIEEMDQAIEDEVWERNRPKHDRS
jgi:AbrB family looped-hinge helix DNA binding protein